jgi:hypothetical protein
LFAPIGLVTSLGVNIVQNERGTKKSDFDSLLYIVANHKIVLMVVVNKEPKVAFENKMYPEIYYHHNHVYR